MVESRDSDLLVRIFLDNPESVFVSIERCHENEGNVDTMGHVEMFDLSNGEIQKGHVVLHFEGTFGSGHA